MPGVHPGAWGHCADRRHRRGRIYPRLHRESTAHRHRGRITVEKKDRDFRIRSAEPVDFGSVPGLSRGNGGPPPGSGVLRPDVPQRRFGTYGADEHQLHRCRERQHQRPLHRAAVGHVHVVCVHQLRSGALPIPLVPRLGTRGHRLFLHWPCRRGHHAPAAGRHRRSRGSRFTHKAHPGELLRGCKGLLKAAAGPPSGTALDGSQSSRKIGWRQSKQRGRRSGEAIAVALFLCPSAALPESVQFSFRRASIRCTAFSARPRSTSSSCSANARGSWPITQSVPSRWPVEVTSGMPA